MRVRECLLIIGVTSGRHESPGKGEGGEKREEGEGSHAERRQSDGGGEEDHYEIVIDRISVYF